MLFFPHASLKMCSVRHLLNINSSPVRIWMKYIHVFHSDEQPALPKFVPNKFVASSEKKIPIRVALLESFLTTRITF